MVVPRKNISIWLYTATYGHGKHWISFKIFKFGRSAHIFGKKLTKKDILGILPFLASIRLHGK